jgi:hypothetical protein
MDGGQEVFRIDAVVVGHQAGQGRAVLVVVALLDRPGLVAGQAGHPLHEVGHAPGDQRHDLALDRVEGVVEIEQPGVDVRKVDVTPSPAFPRRAR